MEHLIDLLNEYDKPLGWYYEDGVLDCKLNLYEYMAYEWICSARYGFIKWLVENDKINIDKVENKANFEFTCNYIYKKDEIEDKLLMLLSISDKPIEDLLLYLK